jgi:hypothetical protein
MRGTAAQCIGGRTVLYVQYVAQWEGKKLSNREGLDLHNSVGFEFSRSEGMELSRREEAGAKKEGE